MGVGWCWGCRGKMFQNLQKKHPKTYLSPTPPPPPNTPLKCYFSSIRIPTSIREVKLEKITSSTSQISQDIMLISILVELYHICWGSPSPTHTDSPHSRTKPIYLFLLSFYQIFFDDVDSNNAGITVLFKFYFMETSRNF